MNVVNRRICTVVTLQLAVLLAGARGFAGDGPREEPSPSLFSPAPGPGDPEGDPVLADAPFPPIPVRIPPPGIEVPPEDRAALGAEAGKLRERLRSLKDGGKPRRAPDVEIFVKAVEYALRHDEFWKTAEIGHARELLAAARSRLEALERGEQPWRRETGAVVRGYLSALDDSVQPYGLLVPGDLDFDRPGPLYVWLHGRAEKTTDLQFIRERMHARTGGFPADAIVLHPFGRYCNAFKSAGEVDVLESIAQVEKEYAIDPDRVVLMGFSMGGAGAWHLGAHHAGRWVAVSPGAGFAETARYNHLTPDRYPPWYEQRLWGLYDVPDYVRNLFNTEVVAYSGEKDRQIQAARVMEEAYAAQGRKLTHIIGPGMGHRYDPESRKTIFAMVGAAARKGREAFPRRLSIQTRTLRYSRMRWLQLLGLAEHWRDSRVDADWTETSRLTLKTQGVRSIAIRKPAGDVSLAGLRIEVDGQELRSDANGATDALVLELGSGEWHLRKSPGGPSGLRKRPGLQGPIDDVFMEPFLVVVPGGSSSRPRLSKWLAFEVEHFKDRWQRLFRGQARVKVDRDVSDEDIARYHLIVWGDRESNAVLARLVDRLPLRWTTRELGVGDRTFDASRHVPVMIYPNPLNPERYVVLNSGLTFRENHDRTNSLQNPKLPDWAILDLSVAPDGSTAGAVADAGFFDESWQVKTSR